MFENMVDGLLSADWKALSTGTMSKERIWRPPRTTKICLLTLFICVLALYLCLWAHNLFWMNCTHLFDSVYWRSPHFHYSTGSHIGLGCSQLHFSDISWYQQLLFFYLWVWLPCVHSHSHSVSNNELNNLSIAVKLLVKCIVFFLKSDKKEIKIVSITIVFEKSCCFMDESLNSILFSMFFWVCLKLLRTTSSNIYKSL